MASVRTIPLSSPVARRAGDELVSEVLGPAASRSARRSTASRRRSPRRSARRTPPPSRAAPRASTCSAAAGVGPGDEVVTARTRSSPRPTARSTKGRRRCSPTSTRGRSNLDPGRGRGCASRRARARSSPVDIYGYPASSTSFARCATHGLALIEDACEALGARYSGRAVGSHGDRRRCSRSTPTSRSRRARAAWSRPTRARVARSCEACATRAAPTPAAGSSTPPRLQLPDGRRPRRHRARRSWRSSTRSSRREPRSPRGTPRCSRDIGGSSCRAPDDAEHERSWFVYVVALPAGSRSRGRDRATLARARRADRALPARASTSSRTCSSASGIASGSVPWPRSMASRTLALPFHARLSADDQEYVAESLHAALGVVAPGPSQGEALATWALWDSSRRSCSRPTVGSIRRRRTTSRAMGSRAGEPQRHARELPDRARRDRTCPRRVAGAAAVGVVGGGAGDRAVRDDPVVRRPGQPRRALGERRPCAREC